MAQPRRGSWSGRDGQNRMRSTFVLLHTLLFSRSELPITQTLMIFLSKPWDNSEHICLSSKLDLTYVSRIKCQPFREVRHLNLYALPCTKGLDGRARWMLSWKNSSCQNGSSWGAMLDVLWVQYRTRKCFGGRSGNTWSWMRLTWLRIGKASAGRLCWISTAPGDC